MDDAQVGDDEVLYRRIPQGMNLYTVLPDATVKLNSQAFSDRWLRPSVDRALLCQHDPTHTQRDPTDGVVSIVTIDVRQIKDVLQNDPHGNLIQIFIVDVVPAPIVPDNLAHAQIQTDPTSENKAVFRKLIERLARL